MKQSNSQKINLGLFVTIATVLFIAAVYLIGQRQDMFKKTFTISAYFQNINVLFLVLGNTLLPAESLLVKNRLTL